MPNRHRRPQTRFSADAGKFRASLKKHRFSFYLPRVLLWEWPRKWRTRIDGAKEIRAIRKYLDSFFFHFAL